VTAAIPAAQAMELPPNVVEWIAGFGTSASQMDGVEMNADKGITPPPRAFPRHMMSGTTFQWSIPQSLPVLPMPV
jgi:hypothetical protein